MILLHVQHVENANLRNALKLVRAWAFIPVMNADRRRLRALLSFGILDTPPEQKFDSIVELARLVCRAPIALVSLVAADRQWFKARAGLDATETPLDQSVCAHTIRQDDVLVIPDLTADPRTAHNTLVTGPPHIRFYAGAVLKTDSGEALGALCVIDTETRPHGLTNEQVAALRHLAGLVMALLEMHRSMLLRDDALVSALDAREIADAAASLVEAAQVAGQVGIFEVDVTTDTIAASNTFRDIYGLPRDVPLSTADVEALVLPEDRKLASNAALRADGTAPLRAEFRIRRQADQTIRWLARRGQFQRGPDGRVLRFAGTIQDITDRKIAEAAQQLLNDELAHRMKNTFTMVGALAQQTLGRTAEPSLLKAFTDRLMTLSTAHEVLLSARWVAAGLWETAEKVLSTIIPAGRVKLEGPPLALSHEATLSLSLLLHELATNAVKYGALSVPEGHVELRWDLEDEQLVLRWNEIGGPSVTLPTRTGFGSRLIKAGLRGNGSTDIRYRDTGLFAEFRTPATHALALAPSSLERD